MCDEDAGAAQILRLFDPSEAVRVAAGTALLQDPPPVDCLSTEQKNRVVAIVSQLLSPEGLWRKKWDLCVLYASVVQTYCDGALGSRLLLRALECCGDQKLALQLFFNLRVFCFTHHIDLKVPLWRVYFDLCQQVFSTMDVPPLEFTPHPKRMIILTAQMLGVQHQPSRDVRVWASMLQQDFGYEVAILNSCENPAISDLPCFFAKISHRQKEYHGLQREGTSGAIIFTPTCDMPTPEGYRQICAFVQAWQPAFILNFGAYNFSGEFLGRFCHVVSMEAGTDFPPTRTSRELVTFREMNAADQQVLKQLAMSEIPRIRTRYCFGTPKISETFLREKFDLSAEDIVLAVVGNRLGTEMTDENLALFGRVLAQNAKLKILFVGPLEPADELLFRRHLPPQQIRFAGFISDVPSLFDNVCDGYLNPVRTGGGGSAAYALAAGLPVFTLNSGHVAANTDPDFVFASEAALLTAIRDFAAGKDRAALAAKARAWFAQISDRRVMLRDILSGAGLLH